MDKRPIGVYDSGLGGLTAVRKFAELLPNEDIVYLGDTGRIPYGTRSEAAIIKYAAEAVDYLSDFDLKAIAVACGTVSTTALTHMRQRTRIPVYGVVEPSAERAAVLTHNGRIGIIGTGATIRSGAFGRCVSTLKPGCRVFSAPCPLFVPLVENGRVLPGDTVIETVTAEYLKPLKDEGIDVLLLACTHYPLLSDIIANYMGENVRLVDSGAELARYTAQSLGALNALTDSSSHGRYTYYVTDETEGFAQMASLFLSRDISGLVTKIELC